MNDIRFPIRIAMILPVFLIHELLHILVAFRIGNIYLTHSGLYFWLHSDAKMSKGRFWIFMTLPFLVLSGIPLITKFFYSGALSPYILYVGWINAVMASSDIINSILILFKPRNAIFYRGYYKCWACQFPADLFYDIQRCCRGLVILRDFEAFNIHAVPIQFLSWTQEWTEPENI